jgi:2-dehydropantoate 2-reductase
MEKYLFIAFYGLVGGYSGAVLGEMYEDSVLQDMVKGVINEIGLLAIKKGVKLSGEDLNNAFKKASDFRYDTITSYQRDFLYSKNSEGELYHGPILALAADCDVKVPVTRKIFEQIKSRA